MHAAISAFRLVAAALLLWASAAPAGAVDPYPIHVVFEQTGPLAFVGAKELTALRALEGVVNAGGGIRGRPLTFVLHDTTSSLQVAVQLTSQLAAQKVPVILGPALSAVCSAVFPIVQKTGPVEWCFSPVVRPEPGSYSFMGGPGLDDVQPVILRYFYERGARTFALITSTDSTGQVFEQTFDGALGRLEFRGAKLVAREHFNTADISVAAQIARIKAAKPDALITYTSGPPFGTLLRAVYDAGLDIPVYGSGANMSAEQMQQYGSFLPKELILNAAQGVLPDPKAPAAVKRRQAVFFAAMKKTGAIVDYPTSIVWDPALCIVEALRVLGPGATADQLHDYLEHLRGWVGIQGVYNFSTGDQRGIGENGAALFRWNAEHKNFDMVATGPRFL